MSCLCFCQMHFVFHCSHTFVSCKTHSWPYHHSLLHFNSSADIPRVSISAGLCFVILYRNATCVSLMISVIFTILQFYESLFYKNDISFCSSSTVVQIEESDQHIFSAYSNFISLVLKRRLLVPINMKISSRLEIVGFLFGAFLAL